MTYYHCSPTPGLTMLQPGQPAFSEKPRSVYLTTLLPMALMYGVRNYEYTYGYTKDGQIYFEEYFPNALEILYSGKRASLYVCDPKETTATKIPNEAVSADPVPVLQEIEIPDVYLAMLEQERLGALPIYRYESLSSRKLEWIRDVEAKIIRERNLLQKTGPEADYYRTHYPESWKLAAEACENADATAGC